MPRAKASATRIICRDERGNSYRVTYCLDGDRLTKSFTSGEARETWIKQFQKEAAIEQGITTEQVLMEWLAYRLTIDLINQPFIETGIRTFLGSLLDEPIAAIHEKQAKECYERDRLRIGRKGKKTQIAVTTSQLVLDHTRRMFDWALENGHVKQNPLANVKKVGKRNSRKAQIETRTDLLRFKDVLVKHATTLTSRGKPETAARIALTCLYLGIRPGEALSLEAKHIDTTDIGHIVIPGSKTRKSYRHLRCGDKFVNAMLVTLAKHRPTGKLFHIANTHLGRLIKSFAKEAAIANWEKITTHSLRGIAASLATSGDSALRAVADALGHAHVSTSLDHYVTPSALAQASVNQAAGVLGPAHGNDMEPIHFPPSQLVDTVAESATVTIGS